MLTLVAFFIGCLIGFIRSRMRGGKIGDQIQWALVHGIALALLTLIVGTVYLNLSA